MARGSQENKRGDTNIMEYEKFQCTQCGRWIGKNMFPFHVFRMHGQSKQSGEDDITRVRIARGELLIDPNLTRISLQYIT